MAGPPAPPPACSNSSAPQFKAKTSGPSPGHAPASPAAAAPPSTMVRIPSDAALAVLGVVGELHGRGRLAGLEIPEAELLNARAPALFEAVLAAFLAESEGPGAVPFLPIPPPPLADGRKVELLLLYLAVRSRGGFPAVASWAAVAEDVGLDPFAAAAVKLMYAEYLTPLEQSIRKPGERHEVVGSSGKAGRRLGSKKDKFLSPTKNPASAGPAHLKRKRKALVGMLDWVRLVAKSPDEPRVLGRNPGGHFSTAVLLRGQMFANNDCRSCSSSPQIPDEPIPFSLFSYSICPLEVPFIHDS
ncbi:uncharacterized protein LOC133903150 [Phragmites australis]|uniref:uncharacterized protein LOC133903150 n=1 Tax=Phragmites australis TaxID=29695 RepID=UPI002D79A93E|nr:uncharacterized protein LOC133903150 [Phragmites australis]